MWIFTLPFPFALQVFSLSFLSFLSLSFSLFSASFLSLLSFSTSSTTTSSFFLIFKLSSPAARAMPMPLRPIPTIIIFNAFSWRLFLSTLFRSIRSSSFCSSQTLTSRFASMPAMASRPTRPASRAICSTHTAQRASSPTSRTSASNRLRAASAVSGRPSPLTSAMAAVTWSKGPSKLRWIASLESISHQSRRRLRVSRRPGASRPRGQGAAREWGLPLPSAVLAFVPSCLLVVPSLWKVAGTSRSM
ncbi:hypothetical protein IWZ03DRAFT_23308 [Phyllosticta citriasiana]|uniref:Uncharacterized protein n=1 Tax=Phyllosticta citriasiana TaxID=595635 RepID=A0ABR1KZU2_9PEZI